MENRLKINKKFYTQMYRESEAPKIAKKLKCLCHNLQHNPVNQKSPDMTRK